MCKINAEQIKADGQAVGQALLDIANSPQIDPTIAANLRTAANALIAATQNWQEGSSQAVLEDAEQAAIVVLNSIPQTAPYAGLVAIAFVALNLLIANSQTQTTQKGDVVADAHALLTKAKTLNTNSPWYGKAVIKHKWNHSPRQDFADAWNTELALLPASLGIKPIQG